MPIKGFGDRYNFNFWKAHIFFYTPKESVIKKSKMFSSWPKPVGSLTLSVCLAVLFYALKMG